MTDFVVDLDLHARLKWEAKDRNGADWRRKYREEISQQAQKASHDKVVIQGADGTLLEAWPASSPPAE